MTKEQAALKKAIEKASEKFGKQFNKIEAFKDREEPKCSILRQELNEVQKQCKHDGGRDEADTGTHIISHCKICGGYDTRIIDELPHH